MVRAYKKYAKELQTYQCLDISCSNASGVFCVKRILQDQFLRKWCCRISVEEYFSSSKLYKDVHEFEEYVDLLREYLKYSLLDLKMN